MRIVPTPQLEVGCVYRHRGDLDIYHPFRVTAERFVEGRREFQIEVLSGPQYMNKDYWYDNSSGVPKNYWLVSSTPDDPHIEDDY